MAGIGFELKKLFKTNSIISKLRGSGYAAMITIGPLILIIVTLFIIYAILGYSHILYASKELLASTILYVFIFALCTTAPFNAVLSRYIADKIYENKQADILPAYYSSLAANALFAGFPATLFCLWGIFVGHIDAIYMLAAYLAYLALVFVFFNMLYITALKEYKKISISFLVGMLITLIFGVILAKLFGVSVELSIISALAAGFGVVAFALFGLVRAFFRENSRNYTEVFQYFKSYKYLIVINSLYILGLYVHNFIFWLGSDLSIVVSKTFISAPIYDMTTCIAMFINISTMVIFIVEVETNFHKRYQVYCQTVLGGTGEDILYAKKDMFRSIKNELLLIFQLQTIFTTALFFICIVVLPSIAITGMVLTILPTLVVAYFMIFIMYDLVIFIYYFNVYSKALYTVGIFFIVTTIGSIISRLLPPGLYGLGVLLGAFAGFTYAFYAIKDIEKNLDYHIFCKGQLVNQVVDEHWGHSIYKNDTVLDYNVERSE